MIIQLSLKLESPGNVVIPGWSRPWYPKPQTQSFQGLGFPPTKACAQNVQNADLPGARQESPAQCGSVFGWRLHLRLAGWRWSRPCAPAGRCRPRRPRPPAGGAHRGRTASRGHPGPAPSPTPPNSPCAPTPATPTQGRQQLQSGSTGCAPPKGNTDSSPCRWCHHAVHGAVACIPLRRLHSKISPATVVSFERGKQWGSASAGRRSPLGAAGLAGRAALTPAGAGQPRRDCSAEGPEESQNAGCRRPRTWYRRSSST